jgi:hypothetical protein
MGKPNGGARELSSWRRIVAQRDLVIVDAIWEPSQCSDKALVLSTSKALRRAGQSLDMTQLLEEQGFLEHLIIRQRNQHRGSVHFRKLIDVQRKVRRDRGLGHAVTGTWQWMLLHVQLRLLSALSVVPLLQRAAASSSGDTAVPCRQLLHLLLCRTATQFLFLQQVCARERCSAFPDTRVLMPCAMPCVMA